MLYLIKNEHTLKYIQYALLMGFRRLKEEMFTQCSELLPFLFALENIIKVVFLHFTNIEKGSLYSYTV